MTRSSMYSRRFMYRLIFMARSPHPQYSITMHRLLPSGGEGGKGGRISGETWGEEGRGIAVTVNKIHIRAASPHGRRACTVAMYKPSFPSYTPSPSSQQLPHHSHTQKSLVQPYYPGVGEGGQETDFIQSRKQLLIVQRAYIHLLERIGLAIHPTSHLQGNLGGKV